MNLYEDAWAQKRQITAIAGLKFGNFSAALSLCFMTEIQQDAENMPQVFITLFTRRCWSWKYPSQDFATWFFLSYCSLFSNQSVHFPLTSGVNNIFLSCISLDSFSFTPLYVEMVICVSRSVVCEILKYPFHVILMLGLNLISSSWSFMSFDLMNHFVLHLFIYIWRLVHLMGVYILSLLFHKLTTFYWSCCCLAGFLTEWFVST